MPKKMKKPEKGKTHKPKKVTTANPPGGPETPGAKKARYDAQTTDSNN